MKTIFAFTLLFTICCFGQNKKLTDKEYNESGVGKIRFALNVQEAENLAKSDLKAKKPFLLIQGGIASIIYPTDKAFTKAYGVDYYDFGCVGAEKKISTAYNNIIFEYLCRTYGRKWKNIIRKDVIGLKEYKKRNGC